MVETASSTATIVNDPRPVVSLFGVTETMTEGGVATFGLRRYGSTAAPLTVTVDVHERPWGYSGSTTTSPRRTARSP